MVRSFRRESEMNQAFPRVVFFFQGTAEQGEVFFRKRWPGATAVTDPDRLFFRAFRLRRGRFHELIGPKVWASAVRAMLKGHIVGKPVGDPRFMPGVFVVRGNRVLWEQTIDHIGRMPRLDGILAAARSQATE
jgi:hypothetical protein